MVFLRLLQGGISNPGAVRPGIAAGVASWSGVWLSAVASGFVGFGLASMAAAAEPASAQVALAAADRVLVLGDSITFDGRWVADVAAWMEREGLEAAVIDCGLSSETVSGL